MTEEQQILAEIMEQVKINRETGAYPLMSNMVEIEREFKKVLNSDVTLLDVSHMADVVRALSSAVFKMCGFLTGAQELEHATLDRLAIALSKYFNAVTKNNAE